MKDVPEVTMGDRPDQYRQNSYTQEDLYQAGTKVATALGQGSTPTLSADKCLGENYESGSTPKSEKSDK